MAVMTQFQQTFAWLGPFLALIGTVIQASTAMLELREQRDRTRPALTIDELLNEVPWYHPWVRKTHRKTVRQLMKESPKEAAEYRRLRRILLGWSTLMMAALLSFLVTLPL